MDSDIVLLFLQQGIASGLVTGSVYALLAIAIVIVFRTTDVANFAEGEFYMAAAYFAFFLIAIAGVPIWLALPLTLVAAALAAGLFQRVVLRRVAAARGVAVNLVIATLGLSYVLKGLVRATGFGDTPRTFPSVVPDGSVTLGEASLSYLDLTILAAALAVMAAFFAVFNLTRTGRAMRAVGMNRRAAQLVGINLGRTERLVWAFAGGISSVAAILIAPKLLMTAEMGVVVTLAFAAAIVGGFTSLPGAVVGGFIIGVAENLVGLFVSTRAINVAPFVIIMLVLVFKPQGLFGGRLRVRKV
ncbi:High-affinity branched-chain amino acid transport system permease protein LivH [Methylobacterium crusticola]|uniref:High-affinity branched-chain amino acid transport system permease protein LivH n=1 Tax=Methylobacterium crusticola TaxID=1697972 RepID=A0ABQ4QYC0_9HYPH|nr:branched-chain amino acid ABC transporter permease [Methylobacterium crusticola]GJD50253.1 High-affinity branched-chain amino acid transport system permease protein LivH [Methylobacterium crusticola]